MHIVIIIKDSIIKMDIEAVLRGGSTLTLLKDIKKMDYVFYAKADFIIIDADDYTDVEFADILGNLDDPKSKVIVLSSNPDVLNKTYQLKQVFNKPFVTEAIKNLVMF